MKKLELIGKRFNRLTVISQAPVRLQRTFWNCLCDCGNECVVWGSALTTGQTQSCGCFQKDRVVETLFKHGAANKTAEYRAWVNIKTRCYNKKVNEPNYIQKGIKVCDRWLNSFVDFLSDMGKKPTPLHSIERLNSKGNYEPGNCKWGTEEEQVRNKCSNSWHEHNGARLILQDWANYFGVHQANLINSIKAKGFEKEYEYYNKKYNGVFPNGEKVTNVPTPNYNKPKAVTAFKDGHLVFQTKSVRAMSRETNIHHFIIETSIKNNKPHKGLQFYHVPRET